MTNATILIAVIYLSYYYSIVIEMETLVIFESISEVVIGVGWFCLQLINWGKLAGRAFTVKIKFVQQKNFEIYKKSLLEKIIGQFFHPSKYYIILKTEKNTLTYFL